MTIPAGVLSQSVPIYLTCDGLTEGTEFFTATISSPTSALLGTPSRQGTIYDGCVGGPFTFGSGADLAITMTDSDPVLLGQPVTYDLQVTNLGPQIAQNVSIIDGLPGATNLIGATTGQGACSGAGIVTCNLGLVLPGQSVPLHLVAAPSVLGTLFNTAAVSSTTFDPFPGNNTAAAATNIFGTGLPSPGLASNPVSGSGSNDGASSASNSDDAVAPGMELHFDRTCHLIDDRVCTVDVLTGENSRVRLAWNIIVPAFARTAQASRVMRFRTISRRLTADESREFNLAASRRVRRLIARALAHRVPVTGRFRITATDAAGNVKALSRSFRIVR